MKKRYYLISICFFILLNGCSNEDKPRPLEFQHDLFSVEDKVITINTTQKVLPIILDIDKNSKELDLILSINKQPERGAVSILDADNGIVLLDTESKSGSFIFEVLVEDSNANAALTTITVNKELAEDSALNTMRQFKLKSLEQSKIYTQLD